ncbi:MAG: 6,7-dimethyl-8-ribityllumazine synthase [FCB group bacterium]|nr:6,7-dimethyl-8-ribityllumazine synthase [FCB group bacterium]
MVKTLTGKLDATGKKFGIVVSRFNELVSGKLLEGAIDCLVRHNCAEEDIEVCWVPGSFEIPSTAGKMTVSDKYSAVICLGALIRGGTPHFDYLAAEVTKGVAQLGMQGKIPVIFGVITTDNLEQALERAGTKAGNKGKDAAESAIEMVNLWEQL